MKGCDEVWEVRGGAGGTGGQGKRQTEIQAKPKRQLIELKLPN